MLSVPLTKIDIIASCPIIKLYRVSIKMWLFFNHDGKAVRDNECTDVRQRPLNELFSLFDVNQVRVKEGSMLRMITTV